MRFALLHTLTGAEMRIPNDRPSRSFMPLVREQIMTHKWLESQRLQRDLGCSAIENWVNLYWTKFVQARRREHLNGEQRWRELEDED